MRGVEGGLGAQFDEEGEVAKSAGQRFGGRGKSEIVTMEKVRGWTQKSQRVVEQCQISTDFSRGTRGRSGQS